MTEAIARNDVLTTIEKSGSKWRVGSDIGGTFTDLTYIDDQGTLHTAKVPSSPDSYGRSVVDGINLLAKQHNMSVPELEEMVHGCTVATNAILEFKGAKTALITTAGFRDVLELRRIVMPRLYEPLYVKPQPLSPRGLRFEIDERVDAAGNVVSALEDAQLEAIAQEISRQNVEAVAVCFLHSYMNPEHEKRASEVLRRMLPGVFVTVSSDVLPQIREYERTSTTVINAYVGPLVEDYLETMTNDLRLAGCSCRLMVMQSSGGTINKSAVVKRPAQIIECGPAAGVVGAAYLCERLGINEAITFDMGGTTAKASLIENGELTFTNGYEVGSSMSTSSSLAGGAGYALKLPLIDISEVGAGGGSIVHLDKAGSIKIGPESAGAHPGPACYDQGGTEPTVTDANVTIGFLSQTGLAGGTVPINPELSKSAIRRVVSEPLELELEKSAYGVHEVANATMIRAIKSVTTNRGRDPRDFAIIAFGGNGGVHGAGIARNLEVRRVIVPPAAGVFSAVGLLVAKQSVSVVVAFRSELEAADAGAAKKQFAKLRDEANQLLELPTAKAKYKYSLDMRYVGQAFELPIPLEDDDLTDAIKILLRTRFDNEHEQRFGHKFDATNKVEIISLKVQASDPASLTTKRLKIASFEQSVKSRNVYFGDKLGSVETPVVNRAALTSDPRRGPFIVEEYEGTTVVPPDAFVHRDHLDNIVIDLEYAKAGQ